MSHLVFTGPSGWRGHVREVTGRRPGKRTQEPIGYVITIYTFRCNLDTKTVNSAGQMPETSFSRKSPSTLVLSVYIHHVAIWTGADGCPWLADPIRFGDSPHGARIRYSRQGMRPAYPKLWNQAADGRTGDVINVHEGKARATSARRRP